MRYMLRAWRYQRAEVAIVGSRRGYAFAMANGARCVSGWIMLKFSRPRSGAQVNAIWA